MSYLCSRQRIRGGEYDLIENLWQTLLNVIETINNSLLVLLEINSIIYKKVIITDFQKRYQDI